MKTAVFLAAVMFGGSLLAAQPQVRIFKAGDLGLRPNSGRDESQAFAKALRTVIDSGGPAELLLETGVYKIGGPGVNPTNPDFNYALGINRARGFTLRGAGRETKLIVTRPQLGLFSANECAGLAFKAFSVDYEPPGFTQGTIQTADPISGTYTLQLDQGFPEFDAMAVFSHAEGRLGRGVTYVPRTLPDGSTMLESVGTAQATAIKKLGSRLWRIKMGPYSFNDPHTWTHTRQWPQWHLLPGTRNLIQSSALAGAVWVANSEDITFEDVTFYMSPSVAIRVYYSQRVTVRGCAAKIREGSGRLQSTNADVLHFAAVRGPILIENCRFEDQSDDHINIHEPLENVIAAPAPEQLVLDSGARTYRAGDKLWIVDQVTKMLRCQADVKKVERFDAKTYLVTIDKPVSGLVIFRPERDSVGKIGETRCDIVWNISRASGPTIIRNNYFKTGGSVLPNLVGGLIENNVFDNNGGSCALRLGYTTSIYSEGPSPSDIVIRNNTFRNQSRASNNFPVISAHFWPTNPLGRLTSRLTIEGNRFIDCGTTAIYLRSVSHAALVNNRVEAHENTQRAKKLEYYHPDSSGEGPGYPTVFLDNCDHVVVDRLTVHDSGAKAAVMIGKHADPGPQGVKVTDLKVVLAKDAPAIIDLRSAPVIATPLQPSSTGTKTMLCSNRGSWGRSRCRQHSDRAEFRGP
jgi:hypothetical protein